MTTEDLFGAAHTVLCCAGWAMQHVQTNSAHICGRLFVINLSGLPWLLNGVETFKQSTFVGVFHMELLVAADEVSSMGRYWTDYV